MNIGDSVKISGTKLTGVIVNIEGRRDSIFSDSKTIKSYYTIKLSDGTENEYMRDEIRLLTNTVF